MIDKLHIMSHINITLNPISEIYFDACSHCDKITGNFTVALIKKLRQCHTEPLKGSLMCNYDKVKNLI